MATHLRLFERTADSKTPWKMTYTQDMPTLHQLVEQGLRVQARAQAAFDNRPEVLAVCVGLVHTRGKEKDFMSIMKLVRDDGETIPPNATSFT